VFTYDGVGAFGELALMYACPRAATVTVRRVGFLIESSRLAFRGGSAGEDATLSVLTPHHSCHTTNK
jgi:hypothetical protein